MKENAADVSKDAPAAALLAVVDEAKSAEPQSAENTGKKAADFRVMPADDTKIKPQDDTKIAPLNDTNFAGGALRKLIGIGKRITATMRLTTYTSGGIKYFRYQEPSAALRKINPPVHLAPYSRRKGKDNLDYDNRAKIEEFKAKRKVKSRRRKSGGHGRVG